MYLVKEMGKSMLSSLIFILGFCLLLHACASVSVKRPETAEELYYSNEIVKATSYSLAYGCALKDIRNEANPKAEHVRRWYLAAQTLSDMGGVLAKEQRALTELEREQLREIVKILYAGQDGSEARWESLLFYVPWWLNFAEIDPRDRAQLSTFCVEGAAGILDAYKEVKTAKGW